MNAPPTFAPESHNPTMTPPRAQSGDNEPYAPGDGVYHTLSRHAAARGLPSLMIKIRSDLIREEADQRIWAQRLAPMLRRAAEGLTIGESGLG